MSLIFRNDIYNLKSSSYRQTFTMLEQQTFVATSVLKLEHYANKCLVRIFFTTVKI